jgi:hypothetical protein
MLPRAVTTIRPVAVHSCHREARGMLAAAALPTSHAVGEVERHDWARKDPLRGNSALHQVDCRILPHAGDIHRVKVTTHYELDEWPRFLNLIRGVSQVTRS